MQSAESNPLVSIVIPVYNGSDYLREAIDSALAQTYQNVEVIVVNDGSTDNGKTETIAKSYGDKIRYYYKKNGGVGSALNLGIQKMEGDYFSWLSHDDVYFPNKIQAQISFLKANKRENIVVYSDCQLIDQSSNVIGEVHLETVEPKKMVSALLLNRSINGCSLLIPKMCFNNDLLFDENLITVQDYALWFRMLNHYDFVHIDKLLLKSRQHSKQGSRIFRFTLKKESDSLFFKTMEKIVNKPKDHFIILPISKYFMKLGLSFLKSGLIMSGSKAFLYALRFR